ncbi:MAG: glycosyltransferase [Actinobacteria bacterium]|nr:glycosyltransferase [Actinomycetota bacterium]
MPLELPPVSVIVLSWNGLEVTRDCLRTLLGRTSHPSFDVVVVDNGSTDGTLEYLRAVTGITLIENGRNLGFVGGNNVGIRATGGDVLLLNNDTEIIQDNWLERMQELAYSSEDIGLVGCRLMNASGNLVHAGTYMPLPSFWGQEYPGNERDIGQYADDREVEGVIAACMYIKRRVIDTIGPLDEEFFSYFEDTDYCLKAGRAGYRVFCCGRATVKHLENASTDLNRMDFSGTFKQSREKFIGKWKDHYDSLYTRKLTWRSFITTGGLYSRESRKLLWALDRAGVELNLAFLEGVDRAGLDDFRINDMKNRGADRDRPQVVFGPPETLSLADGSFNIAYVFTAFDRFSTEAVREMNRMDEVWVTSEFQGEAARASGVDRDVVVMPLGVDPEYLNPRIAGYPLAERFAFLAPVDWGPGFASETLLRAFTDEFAPDENVVLLMVVNSPGGGMYQSGLFEPRLSGAAPGGLPDRPQAEGTGGLSDRPREDSGPAHVEEAVEAMNLTMDRAPVVFVMDHEIPAYQAGSLYRSVDCLVLPVRASEVGAAAVEGLACGTPVIATGWGTYARLADGKSLFPIDYRQVPSPEEGLSWAEPEYGHLRELMRAVSSGDGAREEAMLASRRIRAELSWDGVASKMVERLDGI